MKVWMLPVFSFSYFLTPLFCQPYGLTSEIQIHFSNTNEYNKPTVQIHKWTDTTI